MSFVVGKSRESRKRGRKRRRDVSTPVYRCFIGVFSLLSSPTFHSLVSHISLYRSYFRGGQLRATLLEPFPSQTPDKRRRSAPRRRNLNFSRACKCRWNDALRGRGDHTEVDNILSTRLMRIDVINLRKVRFNCTREYKLQVAVSTLHSGENMWSRYFPTHRQI